jgi:hypothetical protein
MVRKTMILFKDYSPISESIQYHADNKIPLAENAYRMGSDKFLEVFREARQLFNEGKIEVDEHSEWFLTETDVGEVAEYYGKIVPLDLPMLDEAEYKGTDVELNKPARGGKKKFYVYVKSDKGNVKKVEWGDTTGLSVKLDDQAASKSFAARHKCSEKKDKTKAGYWACNTPKYAGQLGLKGDGWNGYW